MSDDLDRRYLAYIRDAIGLVEARTRGGREAFFNDVDIQDAVLWRLQTLAEASGKLSAEIKSRHPDVRWRAVYGFRNVAAHGYLELRLDDVWEIVMVHLPALKIVIEEEIVRSSGR
ncbi:MAG: HepT-like ribonuclease domain-containing protein [Chloroflexota bacterium]